MRVRGVFAVGLWLAVTAAATAIVWAGTSTVAADLTDRPPPVVAHEDVVEALQPGPSGAQTEPGITAPGPPSAPPTVPGAGRGPAASADAPVLAPAPFPPPKPTPPAPSAAPPTTRPAGPPTTAPPQRPTATYSTAGGVLTVACGGPFLFFIELVSATPANGYAVRVASAGPYYVEVHFVRPGRDEPVWAYCLGRPVRTYGVPEQGPGR